MCLYAHPDHRPKRRKATPVYVSAQVICPFVRQRQHCRLSLIADVQLTQPTRTPTKSTQLSHRGSRLISHRNLEHWLGGWVSPSSPYRSGAGAGVDCGCGNGPPRGRFRGVEGSRQVKVVRRLLGRSVVIGCHATGAGPVEALYLSHRPSQNETVARCRHVAAPEPDCWCPDLNRPVDCVMAARHHRTEYMPGCKACSHLRGRRLVLLSSL
ncbi:hypothetical protein B0H67DRAFT_369715 [Lasiosphaeris hirsuta]|uniref:Uncharacterized protein n=1 Tax=Lasiosphaeris hirsuta TaxID=260670 RepID=A0AA39ZX25_9PEZI|nr:hypothetical protein B0H67DRAFT_369715 [Lasiosphaeris hirsuta]